MGGGEIKRKEGEPGGRKGRTVDGWTKLRMNRYVNGWVGKWVGGGWVDVGGWVDKWIDGRVSGVGG